MVDRLIEVKLAVTTVLLNLSDREWSLAKELRDVLGPFEKVTTVMGGQNYVTMSLIIPLIHGLAEGLEVSLRDSVDMKNFKRKICSELESKFHSDSLEPDSLPLLCSSMDPHFRDLQFLDEDEHRTSVKEALLEQLTEVGGKKMSW